MYHTKVERIPSPNGPDSRTLGLVLDALASLGLREDINEKKRFLSGIARLVDSGNARKKTLFFH